MPEGYICDKRVALLEMLDVKSISPGVEGDLHIVTRAEII